MQPIIRLREVSKSFGEGGRILRVLDSITLDIGSEFIAILGPSGCGKSTLLKIIAGIEKPDSGSIEARGNITYGFVFQSPTLLPWLTVLDNAALPLIAKGISKKEARDKARRYLSLVGLQGFEDFYPNELSGGMKQRVNIARALAVEPSILLMDEPFSQLDPLTAEALRAEVVDLWLSGVTTVEGVIMVTHNVEEAVYMADRIVILTPRPAKVAKVVEVGLPRPRDRRSKEFQDIVDAVYEYVS
ncbi:ABC transporter ATP-binding protein [Desulfurococcus mucosus]|uniref:ABC transporter related protein n=1 Tax=Desulfurococcus mucosus (strain ATCC 35584 / DSM 2162 / JCM 9187 / O7/1) TaxID=765177 RepID=E8R7R8_DESM0|nr:ABC transporter ATP-binding protein [Desulfurococcus mucosus]ADV65662.1 ABC transporter related protein [Desulfurococcus mucosus DSM 2162]